jgi:hypothetical protein
MIARVAPHTTMLRRSKTLSQALDENENSQSHLVRSLRNWRTTMQDHGNPDPSRARETMIGRLLLLAFGICVLSFLVAIDRAEWFAIRPATGTSIAMAAASASAKDNAMNGTVGARP